MRLTLECIGHFESLLQVQPGLAHFLDGYKLVMKQGILCLVDGSHAPLAQLSNDVVAFLQQVTWRECPGRDVVLAASVLRPSRAWPQAKQKAACPSLAAPQCVQ